jgi:hypothetical protein
VPDVVCRECGTSGKKNPSSTARIIRKRQIFLRVMQDLNYSRKSRAPGSVLRPAHGDLVGVGSLVVLRRKKKAAVVGTIKLACPHTERASIDPLATEDLF